MPRDTSRKRGNTANNEKKVSIGRINTDRGSYDPDTAKQEIDRFTYNGSFNKMPVNDYLKLDSIDDDGKLDLHNYLSVLGNMHTSNFESESAHKNKNKGDYPYNKLLEEKNNSSNASEKYDNNTLGKTIYTVSNNNLKANTMNCWRRFLDFIGWSNKKKRGGNHVDGITYQVTHNDLRDFLDEHPSLKEIILGESCPIEITEQMEEEGKEFIKLIGMSDIDDIEYLPQILYPNSYSEGGKKTRKRIKKTRKPKQKRRTRTRSSK
jgi:hypothetical protein